jgi:predicted DCC family thiol-disulfide oxidoreductase YuxK
MDKDKNKILVYYDGACPKCIRDRQNYEKLSGKAGEQVCWVDITGRERQLRQAGIDPQKALTELHIRDENGRILSELDAYILLMNKVPLLKPVAWLIGLPLIRPLLAKLYHQQVNRRLRKRGVL